MLFINFDQLIICTLITCIHYHIVYQQTLCSQLYIYNNYNRISITKIRMVIERTVIFFGTNSHVLPRLHFNFDSYLPVDILLKMIIQ